MQAPGPGDALIVVDVQNDFLPGGSLGIPHGDEVVAPLNRLIDAWQAQSLPLFFTRDWHPADHCSFKARGGPWPPHCVQDTPGSEFARELHVPKDAEIISKATDPEREAYSTLQGTDLASRLAKLAVRRLFIGGLATDYCVLATGRDARHSGMGVVVLTDAVHAVDVNSGDGERALQELASMGAQLTTTGVVLELLGRRP